METESKTCARIDLPKNAQGLAASGIARGAAPESIFAALVTPPPPPPPPPPPDDGGGSGGGVPAGDVAIVEDLAVGVEGGPDAAVTDETDEEVTVVVPEAVAESDEDTTDVALAAGLTGAEIAVETLVSEELEEVFGVS